MSLTAGVANLELNRLIEANIIKKVNNFITLPNDTNRYRHNPSKELSKLLLKQFSSYYIQDMSKRLNKKQW